MLICFYSTDNEGNRVSYQSEGVRENDIITFTDKSTPNTTISLSIFDKEISFHRFGNVDMVLNLEEGRKKPCHYKDNMGLEFDFISNCTKLSITDVRVDMEYEMIFDNEIIGTHKIWIIIR